jgi:hypothetical protein
MEAAADLIEFDCAKRAHRRISFHLGTSFPSFANLPCSSAARAKIGIRWVKLFRETDLTSDALKRHPQ